MGRESKKGTPLLLLLLLLQTFGFHKMWGSLWLAEKVLAPWEGLYTMELVIAYIIIIIIIIIKTQIINTRVLKNGIRSPKRSKLHRNY
jgi:hypothetical protein